MLGACGYSSSCGTTIDLTRVRHSAYKRVFAVYLGFGWTKFDLTVD